MASKKSRMFTELFEKSNREAEEDKERSKMGPGRRRQWKSVESIGRPHWNPLIQTQPCGGNKRYVPVSLVQPGAHKKRQNSDWING